MSFALTERQFLDGTKTVTRRLRWQKAQPGTLAIAVRKCMGLKRGERQVVLGGIEILSTRHERLELIDRDECAREGFPHMSPADFVALFCAANKGCRPTTFVNRIEYRRTFVAVEGREWSERLPQRHVLDRGRALCGLPGLPCYWPTGHVWLDTGDARDTPLAIDCLWCREAMCRLA